MQRNLKYDKNWERVQRNEVRETFLHFLELKNNQRLGDLSPPAEPEKELE